MKPNRMTGALRIAVALAVLATATVLPVASASTTGAQGTIYRLYRAYFLRDPDPGGFDYWVRTYQSGYPLPAISNDFARSDEFQSRYGAVDNRRFLELVYNNVLDRAPDQGGYDYWLNHMSRGMPRGYVMIYFSDSAEFRGKVGDGPSGGGTSEPGTAPTAEEAAQESDTYRYINERRGVHGVHGVTRNSCLDEAARRHAATNAENWTGYPNMNLERDAAACGLTATGEQTLSNDDSITCAEDLHFDRVYYGRDESTIADGRARYVGVAVVIVDGYRSCSALFAS